MARVDFAGVKQSVSMLQVTEHYGIDMKPSSGGTFRGPCPFQDGPGHGKSSFIIWTERPGWKCHSCGKKGNVLDFVALKESCSIKEAAERLVQWFDVTRGTERPKPIDKPATQDSPLLVNRPLEFALKGIQHDHPYGLNRGFEPGFFQYLEAGFFPGKGSMVGRFVFPIQNVDGQVVSYAGRLIDDGAVSDSNPRWLLGKGFHKSLELYNLHRVLRGEFEDVIVVESFWGVCACLRAGYPNTVALMGRTLSEEQTSLLSRFASIVLVMDGDEPGRAASVAIGTKLLTLNGRKSIRVAFLPDDAQPDTVPAEELQHILL